MSGEAELIESLLAKYQGMTDEEKVKINAEIDPFSQDTPCQWQGVLSRSWGGSQCHQVSMIWCKNSSTIVTVVTLPGVRW